MGATESPRRNALVFDIETIADLTPATRDAVAALAKGRDMTAEDYGGLCPPLARVVCIAWFEVASRTLGAFVDATLHCGEIPPFVDVQDGSGATQSALHCALRPCAGEADLLRAFGQHVLRHVTRPNAQLVTYNGRGFDLPVLVHRAIKHGVSDGRDVLAKAARENRYNPLMHLDLMDAVTFNGAAPRFPLAAYAIGYGFPSPKRDMDGSQVGPAVHAGRILDVARYCAGDVLATTHVYRCLYEPSIALTP